MRVARNGRVASRLPCSRDVGPPFPDKLHLMTFADLGLSDELLQSVLSAGYDTPTPIQAQAIPSVLMMRDLIGIAQTGTGKTASFVLPMLHVLANGRARARMPRSMIISPTRELATQTAQNFEIYGKHLNLTMALLIGGVSMGDQIKALEKGVDVLIATPGRLMDLFGRGNILLTGCSMLVIDEADRMLDMGFIPDIEEICAKLPKQRQTLLFSATMPPPIKKLADKKGCSITQVALAWVASQGFIAIPGTTKPHRLEENWASRNVELNEEEKAEMRKIVDSAKPYGNRYSEANQKLVGH